VSPIEEENRSMYIISPHKIDYLYERQVSKALDKYGLEEEG